MDIFDIILPPIYLGIFYFFAYKTLDKNKGNTLYKQYYIKGLNYKFLGSFSFAAIYLFYYKGGDSINFYYTASPLLKLLFLDPNWFFKFVLGLYPRYPEIILWDVAQHASMYLTKGSATLTTIRIAGVLNIFCLNSYIVLCLMFAFISYQFIWRTFMLFVSLYPALHKQFSYAFLMIPSALFWGSGVGKDTIMFGTIMLFIFCYYHLFIKKEVKIKYILLLVICAYLIGLIRGFILFTIIPCLMLMTVVYYRNLINNSFARFIVGPFFIAAGIGGSVLFIRSLGESVESYKLDTLEKKAEGFKSWHSYLGETRGGSTYSLGEDFEYTPSGILRKAPLAMAITLFGPFVWQIRNPVMLLSGIESLMFLYFTLRILFTRKIYKLFGVLGGDHIIVFCLPFILILGIAIGITSFNYGALVRYKIPILPFFGTLIILVNYHLNQSNVSELK